MLDVCTDTTWHIILLSEKKVTQGKKITFSFDVIHDDNLFIHIVVFIYYQLRMWFGRIPFRVAIENIFIDYIF